MEAQDGYYQDLETQLLTQSESKTETVNAEDVGNIVAEAIGDAIGDAVDDGTLQDNLANQLAKTQSDSHNTGLTRLSMEQNHRSSLTCKAPS